MDTIFSLVTGSYRAGVAVVRVSGDLALETLRILSGNENPKPRMAHVAVLKDPGSDKILDLGLAVYFMAPRSFTGEDIVEYHLHGGRSVIESVLAVLGQIKGCRLALPGEFTKRAFENEKIDLTEAEAIADLIDAETEAQRLLALEQLGGSLSKLYAGWTETLTKILAHQEADIEFPDEDLPQGLSDTLKPEIKKLLAGIESHLDDGRRGERLRTGIFIAIIGAPNAGKSSLLNALTQRDVAIVSDEAGTTRDVIEVHLDLAGYPVILADTAGLRAAGGKIEAEGIKRARRAAENADLKVALFDATLPEQDAETLKLVDDNTIVAFTKTDLAPNKEGFGISVMTGEGIDQLLKKLTAKVLVRFKQQSGPALTRERHREALEETKTALQRSLAATSPELAAEDLRLGLRALGRITGKVHVEEMLDKIFKDFCIGK